MKIRRFKIMEMFIMSNPIILGISGKRGSGKSLLGKCLAQYGYKTVSLADDLKRRCQEDFGLSYEQTNGAFKEQPTNYKRSNGAVLTPRDIMIRCGVYYRSIDPLFWCKKIKLYDKTVIDDIRFLNEVYYFKSLGAKFVRIERDPELNIYKAAMDDLSECELDSYKDWDALLLPQFNRVPHDLEVFSEYLVSHE